MQIIHLSVFNKHNSFDLQCLFRRLCKKYHNEMYEIYPDELTVKIDYPKCIVDLSPLLPKRKIQTIKIIAN